MGFNYLFIFPPCYVALCSSKALHGLGSESVSWCLETSLFLRLPSWDGAPSLPLLSLFFVFYIFSYLFLKTMSCFSGCLMSSAGIQKLFCGIYSAFKCSFEDTDVYNGLLDSEGEGEGGMIWENGIVTGIVSCKN